MYKTFELAVNEHITNYNVIPYIEIKHRPILLYGSKENGISAARQLYVTQVRRELNFAGFVDSFSDGQVEFTISTGEKITKPKYQVNNINKLFDNPIIVTTVGDEAKYAVTAKLIELGYENSIIPSIGALISQFQNPSVESFAIHYYSYKKVYDMAEDTVSKYLIAKIAAARMGLCPPPDFKKIPQYFVPELINLQNEEVFVDCGAYDGYDSLKFANLTNNHYKSIYMFEPDQQNIALIQEKTKKLSNTNIIQKGLWSSSTTLGFSSDNSSSIITDNDSASDKIETVSLDEFFADIPKDEQPTFIKMDIEGAEIEALKGAANIIKNYKPKLAICVYHKITDMYDIPELIRSINPNYKMSLLHHSDSFYETVLYCY
jgi:FkbM family methyltransferase